MNPPGRSLPWVLWLILGAGAVKARVLVRSQPGSDWAGGREGDSDTARIPSKAWPNIVKRYEPGLVRKTINPAQGEKLAAPAAAQLLKDSMASVPGKEQEESRELGGDEQKEEDEDLAQEDEDQDQELNQKEEQKKRSRDPGQDQGQAQKVKQVQNQEQGEIQETEEEEQQEERGGKERGQEQMRGLEEQRRGQVEEGLRQDEEAGGLEESRSQGHELKQRSVKEQRPIQDLGQKQEQPLAKKPRAKEPQQIPVQPLFPAHLEGPPPAQAKEQVPASTPGPVQERLLLKAFEQASVGLTPGPRSNSLGFSPSPVLRVYEPQRPPPEWEPSNPGPVPPPETHLVMLAWGPWECHCPTGTMSRVRGGKFLGFTERLRSGALSRLQTQHQPCTYARCHCNQEKKECPSDQVSCSSTPGACNPRASLTPLGSPENPVNETAFWKQIQERLEEVWVGLQSLVTEKRKKRNKR